MLSMKDFSRFDGMLNITFGETSLPVNYSIALDETGIKAYFSTTILGKEISLSFQEGILYIDIASLDQNGSEALGQSIKLKADENDIQSLIEYIGGFLSFDMQDDITSSLTDMLKALLNPELDFNLIDSITLPTMECKSQHLEQTFLSSMNQYVNRALIELDGVKVDASIMPSSNSLELGIDQKNMFLCQIFLTK